MPEHHPGDLGGTMRLGKRRTVFTNKDSVMCKFYPHLYVLFYICPGVLHAATCSCDIRDMHEKLDRSTILNRKFVFFTSLFFIPFISLLHLRFKLVDTSSPFHLSLCFACCCIQLWLWMFHCTRTSVLSLL